MDDMIWCSRSGLQFPAFNLLRKNLFLALSEMYISHWRWDSISFTCLNCLWSAWMNRRLSERISDGAGICESAQVSVIICLKLHLIRNQPVPGFASGQVFFAESGLQAHQCDWTHFLRHWTEVFLHCLCNPCGESVYLTGLFSWSFNFLCNFGALLYPH